MPLSGLETPPVAEKARAYTDGARALFGSIAHLEPGLVDCDGVRGFMRLRVKGWEDDAPGQGAIGWVSGVSV